MATIKTHKDGIQVYQGKSGSGKGKWRARLWENGQIIAESGEAYVHQSEADSWASRVFDALALDVQD